MADNIGSGIKITQLPNPSGTSKSDYLVIVHNGNTCKTNLEAIQSFFYQDTSSTSKEIEKLKKQIDTLNGRVNSNALSIDSTNENLNTVFNDYVLNTQAVSQNNSDNISILSTNLETISSNVSSTVDLLSVLIENPELIEVLSALSAEGISGTILELKKDISNISSVVENDLRPDIESTIAKNEYQDGYLDSLKKREEFASTNLVNEYLYDSFNPLMLKEYNGDYINIDKFCFGNSNLSSDGYAYLTVDESTGTLLSVKRNDSEETSYVDPPGKATFDLNGIVPIRTGMFEDAGDSRKLVLETRGESETSIYLSKSKFFTAESVLTIGIGEKILLKSKSNEEEIGKDDSLELLWSGELPSKSRLSFAIKTPPGSSICADNLIAAVAPRLKASETSLVDGNLVAIANKSNEGVGSFCLTVDFSNGYSMQSVPLSVNVFTVEEGQPQPQENLLTGDKTLNVFPRIEHNNSIDFTVNNTTMSQVSAIVLSFFDEIRNITTVKTYLSDDFPAIS